VKTSLTTPYRFVAIFDAHFGQEYKRSAQAWPRRYEKRTTHDPQALNIVRQFMADFLPDVVLLGGDQLNCGPVSHWNKGLPRLTENFRLKDEMDACNELLLKPIDEYVKAAARKRQAAKEPSPDITKHWMTGNHEVWIDMWLDENPGLEGLVEPRAYLNLDQRGWKFYEQGEIARIGKLHYIHGDVLRGRGSWQKLAHDYRRNLRAGHRHTWECGTDVTPIDRQDYHTVMYLPALANCAPAYEKNASVNHQKGFSYGYYWPDGSFNDYVVIINRGTCTINGKRYCA